MRLLVLSLCLLATPVVAQFRGTINGGEWRPATPPGSSALPRVGTGRDLDDIRDHIGDGRNGGQLTRREARQFRREARQLGTLADRYGAGGLSDAEARELHARAAVLREQVDAKRAAVPQRGR